MFLDFLHTAISHGNPERPSVLEARAKELPQRFLVYERPGYMLQTLKYLLGEETFLEVMKTYLNKFRGKKVNTSDFIQVVNSIAPQRMDWFFDYYLKGNRVPRYRVEFKNMNQKIVGILYQDFVPDEFTMPVLLEVQTNQRKFTYQEIVKGRSKTFEIKLNRDERVKQIVVDPDFEILAVRDELEALWKARTLRISATKEKNFEKVRKELFTLWNKYPENREIKK